MKGKIKEFFSNKLNGNNKKNIENLVMFLILLIVTVISINVIWKKDEKQPQETNFIKLAENLDENFNSTIIQTSEYNLQEQLEDILSKITGVGDVQVLITYSETSSIVPMYNQDESTSITEETDSNGGTRVTESTNVSKDIIKDTNSTPVTEKLTMPVIEGAIVIAKGGGDATVKTNIIQAVSAVTGLSTYKIQVFEMVQ